MANISTNIIYRYLPQNFQIHEKKLHMQFIIIQDEVEMNHASVAAAIKSYKESMKEKECEMSNYLIDVVGLSAVQLRWLHIALKGEYQYLNKWTGEVKAGQYEFDDADAQYINEKLSHSGKSKIMQKYKNKRKEKNDKNKNKDEDTQKTKVEIKAKVKGMGNTNNMKKMMHHQSIHKITLMTMMESMMLKW